MALMQGRKATKYMLTLFMYIWGTLGRGTSYSRHNIVLLLLLPNNIYPDFARNPKNNKLWPTYANKLITHPYTCDAQF